MDDFMFIGVKTIPFSEFSPILFSRPNITCHLELSDLCKLYKAENEIFDKSDEDVSKEPRYFLYIIPWYVSKIISLSLNIAIPIKVSLSDGAYIAPSMIIFIVIFFGTTLNFIGIFISDE